jgi:hypothetical protein
MDSCPGNHTGRIHECARGSERKGKYPTVCRIYWQLCQETIGTVTLTATLRGGLFYLQNPLEVSAMPVNILNLPGLAVVDFRETATEYHVRAKPKAVSRQCPSCGPAGKVVKYHIIRKGNEALENVRRRMKDRFQPPIGS